MCNVLVSGTEMEILSESGIVSGVALGAGVVTARDDSNPSVARKQQRIL